MRAAARIRERLVTHGHMPPPVHLPEYSWDQCLKWNRQLDQVCDRGWKSAANFVQQQLQYELRSVQRQLDEIANGLMARPAPIVATQREIYEDLLALNDEFETFALDLKRRQIAVTTESIELEGVYLGPFRITLTWANLGTSTPYKVTATDPQHAASNAGITHPHVNNDKLCEGEAQLPIRFALEQGRLLDFFVIVKQTLLTYNSGSAYVQLSQWRGAKCGDCGYTMDEDETWSCPNCDRTVCLDCSSYCESCHQDRCSECVATCRGCDNRYCGRCLSACQGCNEDFCKECLDDGKCDDCRADEEKPEQEQPPALEDPPVAGTPVHSHSLGQVALSAGCR